MFSKFVRIDNHLFKTIDSYFQKVPIDSIKPQFNILKNNINTNIKNDKIPNEKLGIVFEMAICLLYDIKYNGNFKYSMTEAISLKNKLDKLKTIHNFKLEHVARKNNIYDFINCNTLSNSSLKECSENNLSAKTNNKTEKVCPQNIGQTTIKKWCQYFKIDYENIDVKTVIDMIKKYIVDNIHKILFEYIENTFHCPIVYYYQHPKKEKILYIKLKNKINWNQYNIYFTHINKNKEWNESTSIKINNITIGEFQIHNKRNCIKFRWSFINLLNLFSDNFDIISI
jgi:hypothetical protein